MKKNIFGRKLKRDINARRALFRDLISSLILKERIQTTEAKAKAIKGDVDKIITKVKKRGQLAKRLIGDLVLPSAIDKLINDIAPRFANRSGGYTRIVKIGKRFGDDAMEVIMEFTEKQKAVAVQGTINKKPAPTKTHKRKEIQRRVKSKRSMPHK